MRQILLASALILGFGSLAWGNAFDESRPYRFPTTGDRFNNAFTLDIIEKKKGGFYDGFDTTNNNNNTFITNNNGDIINCSVSATAVGNQHQSSTTATTGSNVLSPAQNQNQNAQGNSAPIDLDNLSSQSSVATGSSSNNSAGNIAGGNDADGSDFSFGSDDQNTVGSGSNSSTVQDQVDNNQNNSGNQTVNTTDSDNIFTASGVSADGNTNNQALNNTQNNNGNQTATNNDSTGCTFNE